MADPVPEWVWILLATPTLASIVFGCWLLVVYVLRGWQWRTHHRQPRGRWIPPVPQGNGSNPDRKDPDR